MWQVVAQASSVEELRNVVPTISEVSGGTQGRVAVDGLPWGTAHAIFDAWGAEQTVGEFLVPEGAIVINCHEENHIGYIEFEITGTPIIPLIWGIAAALAALGILVATITVSLNLPEDGIEPVLDWLKWGAIGVAALAVAMILREFRSKKT